MSSALSASLGTMSGDSTSLTTEAGQRISMPHHLSYLRLFVCRRTLRTRSFLTLLWIPETLYW